MKLTDKQIEFGFNYYFKAEHDQIKSIVEVSEYNGEEKLMINCTQLGDSFTHQYKTQKDKKRVVTEWCDFLSHNETAFKELHFGTRMPQELFDAVCKQKLLKRLEIKWGGYKDISAIENLENIELLHMGSGAGVESIKPLAKLAKLIGLSVENFQKITSYTELSNLSALESLSIEGDAFGPQYIKIDHLDFLSAMPQLKFFRLLAERLQSKDYSPVLLLKNLEHLSLSANKEVLKRYDQLLELPELKWGTIKNRPELYRK
ncbi:leucine-rich repeat domain-containing protein [Pedobacter petrophilus]|uniref:Leucine-rich repeat domain-containing protein n=1 Tax=Pedobacter petrophilus TaxID=1908241 RepID=A0A7K0G047_9SPHI|nr:leucine-rich repeat domain-containing protein [Pedobacter petrophilus]MRX76589.1 leucine-rich repeat domain-containing protein [Pedobacter petrophilus]